MVTVERSRVKSFLTTLVSAAFVYVSLAILSLGTAGSLLIGAAGVVTFTFFGLGWLAMLVKGGPGLVVDDQGFDDRSSLVSVGRVSWDEVAAISEWSSFGVSHLVVHVHHPENVLTGLSWLPRLVARANRRLVGSPVTMTSTPLSSSFTRLAALMNESLERSRS